MFKGRENKSTDTIDVWGIVVTGKRLAFHFLFSLVDLF